MPLDDRSDLPPKQSLQVVLRGCGGRVDLRFREAFIKPRGDPGCRMGLARRVCRLRNGDRIVADRFQQGLHVIGESFAQHLHPKTNRVALVLPQIALLPDTGINRIEQEIE